MRHFVYLTTCTVTGRYYIGVHSTSNIDDGYLGSGLVLRRSVSKYGRSSHTRSVLRYFSSSTDAYAYESKLVTQELIDNPKCMNLRPGGRGGWTQGFDHRGACIKGNQVMAILRTTDESWAAKQSSRISEQNRKAYAEGRRSIAGSHAGRQPEMVERAKTPEAIAKRKKTYMESGHSKGSKNSQYNTCWVSDSGSTKKIQLTELEMYISMGYHRGRKKY